MRYRKLSPTGDMTFGAGLQNFYINVPAAVGQAVGTRLKLWLGEWQFDTSQGTPYLDGILGKHSKETADQTIQSRVLSTTVPLSGGGTALGVAAIPKYESTLNTEARSLSVELQIDTIYGPTAVDLSNYRNY